VFTLRAINGSGGLTGDAFGWLDLANTSANAIDVVSGRPTGATLAARLSRFGSRQAVPALRSANTPGLEALTRDRCVLHAGTSILIDNIVAVKNFQTRRRR
jgi:hypothetical protein